MFPRKILGGVPADLGLVITQPQAGKILGKALVKPILSRGIVEVQKQTCEFVRHRPPGILSSQVENYVVAILSGQEEAGRGNRLALPERRDPKILFVRSEGDDVKRLRQAQLGLAEQLRKDVTHLLQAQSHFPALFVVGIGQHGKMSGTYSFPLRFIRFRGRGGKIACKKQEREQEASGKEIITRHVHARRLSRRQKDATTSLTRQLS